MVNIFFSLQYEPLVQAVKPKKRPMSSDDVDSAAKPKKTKITPQVSILILIWSVYSYGIINGC